MDSRRQEDQVFIVKQTFGLHQNDQPVVGDHQLNVSATPMSGLRLDLRN